MSKSRKTKKSPKTPRGYRISVWDGEREDGFWVMFLELDYVERKGVNTLSAAMDIGGIEEAMVFDAELATIAVRLLMETYPLDDFRLEPVLRLR